MISKEELEIEISKIEAMIASPDYYDELELFDIDFDAIILYLKNAIAIHG